MRTAVRAIDAAGLPSNTGSKAKVVPRSSGPLSCSRSSPSLPADAAAWRLLQSKLVSSDKPHGLASALPLGEVAHRELGLWALDTVNANTCSTLRTYVASTAADAFLAQEAKVVAGDAARSAEDPLASIKW